MTDALAASIHARLLAEARRRGSEFNLILNRYALERWLYRLSMSPAREKFVLKGALLFDLWFDMPHRPTRDADFLGIGPPEIDAVIATAKQVCVLTATDGMRFDAKTVSAEETRKESNYAGVRVKLVGSLGRARCPLQLDVGFGDAVVPRPEEAEFPTLLDDLPRPRLRVYPRTSVVAEKLETMIKLGMINSHMKDYFDLWVLVRAGGLDDATLARAIAETCRRRETPLPAGWPLGLSQSFGADPTTRRQWVSFLHRNALAAPALDVVVAELQRHLQAPLEAARRGR